MSTLTLDDIAALEALHAQATPGPWAVGSGDNYHVEADAYPAVYPHRFLTDDMGPVVADVGNRPDDHGEANAALIAAAVNALPALLALARRALEADAEPSLHDARELMAAECRRLADTPPESADGVERQLWRLACETCGDRVEAMDVRVVSRLVLPDAGEAP